MDRLKVYGVVVTRRDEVEVEAVFSTKEKAHAYIAEMGLVDNWPFEEVAICVWEVK